MRAIVKQDFDYSHDGLTICRLRVGEVHEVSDKLAPGLLDARLIAEITPGAPQAVQVPPAAVVAPSVDARAPVAHTHRSRFDNKRR